MSRRVLVLGANGFVGRNVCRALETHPGLGSVVRHVRRAADIDPALQVWDQPIVLDLARSDAAGLRALFDRAAAQIVVNCTGATAGAADVLQQANVEVVRNVLAALEGRPDIHLVQMGSAAEYGLTESQRPVRESDATRPVNAYGQTKLDATSLVLDAVAHHGVAATVLRVFNPVGPGAPEQTLPGRALRRLTEARREGRSQVELGSLEGFRDYVDVRDVAWAALAAGLTPASSGSVFNVARGEAVQSRELVGHLVTAAGYEGEVVETAAGSDRSVGLSWQQADVSAVRRALPWAPRFSIADAAQALWAAEHEVCAS